MIEYTKDITRVHARLNRDEQIALCEKIQEGDNNARNEVIFSCLPLVIDIAKKFRINNKHIDLEDMVQEGNIALMKAVDRWDAERASITTLTTWYVRNALIDLIHDGKYKIRNPLSLSRRAAEELSKIKRCNTKDINKISKETKLSKKRIKKLMSVDFSSRHSLDFFSGCNRGKGQLSRTFKRATMGDTFLDEDEQPPKPCLADIISLVDTSLEGNHKEIFSRWSGIKGKKQGVKEISQLLSLTVKETMSLLSAAKRTLRNRAKEIRDA